MALTLAMIVGTGCATSNVQTEEELGLRKTDLYTEGADTVGVATSYVQPAAGQSKTIERSFENAPPMISHTVEGMIPVTIKNNTCLTCHLPEVAKAVNATPVPGSHFTDYRPSTDIAADGRISKAGKAVSNTSDFKAGTKTLKKLSGARYNCTLCHAPQSNNKPLVGNNFEPDFRAKDGAKRSNFVSNFDEGIDTIVE